MSTTPTGLQVRGLCKAFGDVRAVDDVSFDVAPGELLAMIGPNGAGKSTTFNVINGQLQADAGSVTFEGQSLLGCTPQQIWQRGIARTFQIAETFASLTVIENVQMALLAVDGRAMAPWTRATRYRVQDAQTLLSQVGLASQAGRAAHELAYGDVKRLELAMALAGEPRLLLMDEPTAGMASAERRELMALTHSLVQQRGLSVLFTEHSMDVVFEHADRVLVLARGQRMALGTAQQVRDDPQVQAVYLGHGRLLQGHRPAVGVTEPVSELAGAQSVAAASQGTEGHNCRASRQGTEGQNLRASRASPCVLLDVQDLCAGYGAARILFDVNLQVQQGEVVALMGRNGAGKSTLLKSLMGLVPQRSGRLRFLSHDLMCLAPHQAAQVGLGYVPEDRRIFTELTVEENLAVGRLPPRQWPDGVSAPHWTHERVQQLFPRLGELWTRLGGRMSGGEQQMLTVARSLMGNPLVLLLDEPSEGVAPVIVEQMAEMILALKAAGVSILLSEQNIAFASWVADTAVVLEKGQVRQVSSMQSLVQDEATRRQYLSV
jgi:branched-chain amino acid transport system ATP-binding protein